MKKRCIVALYCVEHLNSIHHIALAHLYSVHHIALAQLFLFGIDFSVISW